MESLDETEWDVVISGTGLVPSLLALSLSRSGKRVLHVDQNSCYGGDEAAFSLSEAEEWADRFADEASPSFSCAKVTKTESENSDHKSKLFTSRSYSLALAPHLIFGRSSLLGALVSSESDKQLDFQAVGSWFIVGLPPEGSSSQPRLSRVPSSREDVFSDPSLDLRSKRALTKFLRFVATFDPDTEIFKANLETPFPEFLQQSFGLQPSTHAAILALVMSPDAPLKTTAGNAVPGIARHLRSLGMFGRGFAAVMPKWGGLAEIAQVACRAGAVGGGVYVLGSGIESVEESAQPGRLALTLSGGDQVLTNWLAGGSGDLPGSSKAVSNDAFLALGTSSHSVSIVSSSLLSLFPPTSEGGVVPTGAVAVIAARNTDEPPVHVYAHSSDSGECPTNQCVLYASVPLPHEEGYTRLEVAVLSLLHSIGEHDPPQVLWNMRYQTRSPKSAETAVKEDERTIVLPPLSSNLVVGDDVLENVKSAYEGITARDSDGEPFMTFARRSADDD